MEQNVRLHLDVLLRLVQKQRFVPPEQQLVRFVQMMLLVGQVENVQQNNMTSPEHAPVRITTIHLQTAVSGSQILPVVDGVRVLVVHNNVVMERKKEQKNAMTETVPAMTVVQTPVRQTCVAITL
jgi:hypothetical protein